MTDEMMDTARLRAQIAALRPEYEQRLGALVGIPSVGMDPSRAADMQACAQLAGEYLRELGARVDMVETGGVPDRDGANHS